MYLWKFNQAVDLLTDFYLCIADQARNYYSIPDMINSLDTFNFYRDRYAAYTYSPTVSADTTYAQFYKVNLLDLL